ncbi:CAF17-like 4Fe-4S cluster assembly/insertion protein YgfZ [endosymbiont of Ridgeia piscesae]|jgi:folate-binding protein YgfZ|nr:folate-binding protein YgfZ [endosymbiont of Ridgeia piscesae]
MRERSAATDEANSEPLTKAPQIEGCALNDLSHFALIQVEGEDAEQFLQGQLTNDIREVTEQHSQLAGWCTAKGRMMACFRVFRRGDTFLLQTPTGNLDALVKRLRMYVLRAKVKINDLTEDLVRIGLSGGCALDLLGEHFSSIPWEENDVVMEDGVTLIRLPGSRPRFELVGPTATMRELWQKFESQAAIADESFWALQEIRAGQPTIFPQTSEAFVPQMLNMQLVDGISFTKGCYVGQEVVSRMHYLGKLKRRMYLAHLESDQPPQPGDELFAEQSSSGQGTGKVVDARPTNGGYEMLAVIEIASAESDRVLLGKTGPALQLRELPYPFTEEVVTKE